MTAHRFAALHDAGVAVLDCEHKTPPAMDVGHPYIAIPDLRDGRINLDSTRKISDEALREWTRRTKPRKGDVVVTRRGRVGDTAPIPSDVDCAIGQNLVILRSDGEHVDQLYLRWATRGKLWLQEVDRLMNVGAVFSSLNVRDIAKLRIPVPPLPEQRAIAATLGVLDDKIESNRRAVEAGEGLLRALVRRELDAAKDDYAALGDYCSLVKSPVKADDINPSDHYIGFEHMPRGSIFLTEWERAEGLGSHKSRFEVGDVLFGKLRPYFKKVGIAPVRGVCSTDILVLRARDPRDVGLVACVAASDELIDSLSAASTGTRMPRASWKDLAAWPVPRLTDSERGELAEKALPLISRLEALTFESHRLATLRDALLPELLSGRIRVPVDEVA